MKYIVSMKVDARINVEVDADSFEEAFDKAKDEVCNVDNADSMEWIDTEPVNATRSSDDVMADYGCHPYPDNK